MQIAVSPGMKADYAKGLLEHAKSIAPMTAIEFISAHEANEKASLDSKSASGALISALRGVK